MHSHMWEVTQCVSDLMHGVEMALTQTATLIYQTCVQNLNTYYCKTDNIVVIQNTLNTVYGEQTFSSMLEDSPLPWHATPT